MHHQLFTFPKDFAIETLIPAASDFNVESYAKQASADPPLLRDTLFFGTREWAYD